MVFAADSDADGALELYASAPDGSGAWKLNGALTPGGAGVSSSFQIAPDGTRVVYAADESGEVGLELHSVEIDGTDRVTLEDGGPVLDFEITALGRVVFVVGHPQSQELDIHASGLKGEGRVQIASKIGFDTSSSLLVGPADGPAVYVAYDEPGLWSSTVYASRIDGSGTTNLNPTYYVSQIIDVQLTADGSRVVYRTIHEDDAGVAEPLHRQDGWHCSPVEPQHAASSTRGPRGVLRLTPDGSAVLYVADPGAEGTTGLYASPIDGGASVKISAPDMTGHVNAVEVSADEAGRLTR
ncbi:MAG: hypothetical protein WKG00_38095 [Polyangiaceae bacterium]